jgi:hypothetical protein
MTAQTLIDTMRANWVLNAQPVILDADYECPAEWWLQDFFGRAMIANYARLNLPPWIADRHDCDDFAFLAMSLARACHARSSGAKRGVAIGIFIYERTNVLSPGPHAINFAIVKLNGEYFVRFFEPQNGQQVFLAEQEKISATFFIV